MFDWANSAYNLVITSTIFPAYYTAITYTEAHGDRVEFFGFQVVNTALSNFALSFAYLFMAVILPILSSVADFKGNRKMFMMAFTYLGGVACMGLFFFKLETLEWGIVCFTLAAMGYVGGVLFNNSYLPQIATADQQDRVSAQGFAYGYVGCVAIQIICFVFILKPEWFGITDPSFAPRLSFLLVGVWWIGFAQIPFVKLPTDARNGQRVTSQVLRKGFAELQDVWKRVNEIPQIKRFLPAFFFYAMGVQTVMIVAAAFGEKVLHLGAPKLIATILIIQLVAIGGAYLMSLLARYIGNVRVLMLVVCVWIGICVAAYYIDSETQFYILAALVGLVMGGIQSLSRSTYSKLLPAGEADTASFFSFYEVTEKIGIVIGLFSFALIEQLTRNIRYSALSLSLFFVMGLILLFRMLILKKPLENDR
ncbi:MFS transporter, UMF1 family [Parapedobacter luteus]|uniref:MFS transporter, UMF1 family n=2 Tax=Sphingobacteriaceae TaxID=84566 RepID=A0A1T5AQ40_9SPHI|nr:MFS transporter, UMF1 family [Parapedobacter luteus]